MKVFLAPGWRGNEETIAPWIDGLRRRGFDARSVIPAFARAERATAAFLAVSGPDAVIGGTSFGGRVASLAAAEREVRGLLCIAYPLSGRSEQRTAHWPRILCPTLVVNGEEDELAEAAELRRLIPLLRRGRLELMPGAEHDLRPQLDRVLDLAAPFLASL